MNKITLAENLYPCLHRPKWRPDPLFWLMFLAAILMIIGIMLGTAGAEEPNWDEVVPIIIQIESSGNPYAVSQDGCIGLMQISRSVYVEFCRESKEEFYTDDGFDFVLFNPDYNKDIGTWYLKRIWSHYLPHYKLEQNIDNLLIAYNWGIGNLFKYRQGKIKNLPKETQNYIKKYYKLSKAK